MHKVVVDTNVLISAFIGKSFPRYIIRELFLENKITLIVSHEIMLEYEGVSSRKKFQRYANFSELARMTIEAIKSNAVLWHPKIKLSFLKDLSDNKFLETAIDAQADFLITGNSNDFPFGKLDTVEIISPENYCNTFWKQFL